MSGGGGIGRGANPPPPARRMPRSEAAEDRPRRAALAVAGTAAAKAALTELREQSAWVLGAAAILVAFAMAWLAGILLSFRHARASPPEIASCSSSSRAR